MTAGLRKLKVDADTNAMVALLPSIQNFVIYLDHKDILEGINWDDIVLAPEGNLPQILSPNKTCVVESNMCEQLHCNPDQEKGVGHQEFDSHCDSSNDEEDTVYSDFVDSDYEINKEDDDLFDISVDKDVEDGGDKKCNKLGKEHEDNFRESDDGLDILDTSDDEEDVKFNFNAFKPNNDVVPQFNVGMVFESIKDVRMAINDYSIKNRVAIKKPRNNKQRVEAYCADGCPWK